MLLMEHHSDEVEHMRERYGYSKLNSLILATALFELYDETTATGAFIRA